MKSAWNHETFAAGTKLSQSNDGNTYPYTFLINSTLSLDWTTKSAIIQGVGTYNDHKKFKNGQRYLRFLVMPDYSGYTNVTTYYKDFYLREITN